MSDFIVGTLQQAFEEACEKPVYRPSVTYVSLYMSSPFYGGPEEGGWWGRDTEIQSYYRFDTLEEAEHVVKAVEALAERLSKEARDAWSKQCQRECDHAEARGMDPADLPETDGEDEYFVVLESTLNSHARKDSRHYE